MTAEFNEREERGLSRPHRTPPPRLKECLFAGAKAALEGWIFNNEKNG